MPAKERFYKITDNLDLNLTPKSITCDYFIQIDEGVEYSGVGRAEEILVGLCEQIAPIMGQTPQELWTWIQETEEENNSQKFYFENNANIIQTNVGYGEAGSLFNINLIKVLEDGIYNLKGNWHTADQFESSILTLSAGWYTIISIPDESFHLTPIGYGELVKIDEKWMPDSYQDLKNSIPYVTVEIKEVPEYSTDRDYIAGEAVYYNRNQYICTGSTSGEWDSTKWERTEDYRYLLCYEGTNIEITYDEIAKARRAGKVLRMADVLNTGYMYTDANYISTLGHEMKFRFVVEESYIFYLHIPDSREYDKPEIYKNLPYCTYEIYGNKYILFDEGAAKDQLVQYITDRKALMYRVNNKPYLIIEAEILSDYTYEGTTYTNVPKITYKSGNNWIVKYYCASNVIYTITQPFSNPYSNDLVLKSVNGKNRFDTIIKQQNEAPNDGQSIWVTGNGVSGYSAKLNIANEWVEIGNTSAMQCTLTESNNVYSCDKTPQEIYKAFMTGTPVYIKYMGLPIPVVNAVYNPQDDEYYINATITTVVGEELLGRQIGFDGTTWSIDFNDSFIVRGAGSLANIGKYLKATANGVMWDTPEGGSGGGGNTSALETEEMLELLAETNLIETPGVEYTDYVEDPNGEYLYDEELGEWRLAEAGETGTHRAETYVLGYQDYVEDENGGYLYDEELGEWRLAGAGETGTHSLGNVYILVY